MSLNPLTWFKRKPKASEPIQHPDVVVTGSPQDIAMKSYQRLVKAHQRSIDELRKTK